MDDNKIEPGNAASGTPTPSLNATQPPPNDPPSTAGQVAHHHARLNWKTYVAAGAIILAIVVIGFVHGNATPTLAPNVPTVAVAKVARENLTEKQSFEAEFRPYQEIDLHAKVAGFVQSINVDIGDRVNRGDVLAVLEIPELKEDLERAAAQQALDEKEIGRAQAAYDDAHLSYNRLSAINKSRPNLVAQQELDTALAKDAAASASLDAAKQEVAVAKAELDKLKAIQGYCSITAPFTGVVTKRYADEGALVQGGVSPSGSAMPLVRLSQNNRLRLDIPVELSSVARVKDGDSVEIQIPSIGRTITGKIARMTHKVETATRKMEVEVDVPNDDLSLTPGIYADALMTLDSRQNVLTVPTEAVANPASPSVYVLDQANELQERQVKVGLRTPERLEITDGVKENELVMIGSRAMVKPGQKVEPKIAQIGAAP